MAASHPVSLTTFCFQQQPKCWTGQRVCAMKFRSSDSWRLSSQTQFRRVTAKTAAHLIPVCHLQGEDENSFLCCNLVQVAGDTGVVLPIYCCVTKQPQTQKPHFSLTWDLGLSVSSMTLTLSNSLCFCDPQVSANSWSPKPVPRVLCCGITGSTPSWNGSMPSDPLLWRDRLGWGSHQC